MSHVDDGTLHALVDDELDAQERASVEAHLASCGDCARRFAEATAMARQVTTLLGALDEVPSAGRAVPAAPRVSITTPDAARHAVSVPMRRRATVIRRLAIAASVMLVASVSYQVGRQREAPMAAAQDSSTAAATPEALAAAGAATSVSGATAAAVVAPAVTAAPPVVSAGERAARLATERTSVAGAGAAAVGPVATSATQQPFVPSVPMPAPPAAEGARQIDTSVARRAVAVQGAAVARMPALGTYDAASPPSERAMRMRRMEGQLNSVVVTGVQAATAREAQKAAADAAGDTGDARPLSIPGYRMSESESVSSVTVRRYVPEAGPTVTLLIVQASGKATARDARRDTVSQFVVTTVDGQSIVRWHAKERDYELRGALAPDSLVKLATLLR